MPCDCENGACHIPAPKEKKIFTRYHREILCLAMLAYGLAADHGFHPVFFTGWVRAAWYIAAYFLVAMPVIKEGWEELRRGYFFTEFTLMTVATLGALAIGEYAEAVGVMFFYTVGEIFQQLAVGRVRGSIKSLLEMRPATATVLRGERWEEVAPGTVAIGETLRVPAGGKVPLDGEMLSASGSFNTSALTGESHPRTIRKGEEVLAGMVGLEGVAEIRTTRSFEDSSFSRILQLVEGATARKARPEMMIRRLARIYTPVVFGLAVTLALLPYFFVETYIFQDWLYRALIFLVVSCPCALVISIPLSYFGGIGAASRNGILFKGSNYLDQICATRTVVMDKTGTLTEGVFEVGQIDPVKLPEAEFMRILSALESASTHPIARAIARRTTGDPTPYTATEVTEIAGHGLKGKVANHEVLAGNTRLLSLQGIPYDTGVDQIPETVVTCAIDGVYAGYVVIADRLKPDSRQAIAAMRQAGVARTVMLSGDRNEVVQKTASELGVDRAEGDLLPEDKLRIVEQLRADPTSGVVAFVGDGINDAPVLAASDIGIAMGGLGSEAAIETADVVIQTDQPSKIALAMEISRATRRIVFQNITLALGIKVAVMILGAFGIATMWEAVFADVGVALLAILNAVRLQHGVPNLARNPK